MQGMIWNGMKGGLYVLVACVIALLANSLSLALGYKPEGLINETMWVYVVLPALTALVRFLKEYGQKALLNKK